MDDGRTQLLDWLDRSRLQKQELAAKVGISKGYLSQVLMGNRRPKLETLIEIERITGIPVKSWADTAVGEQDRTVEHGA